MVYTSVIIDVGRSIRFYRKAARLSQRQVAEIVGMQRPHLTLIESNKIEPKLITVLQIVAALGGKVQFVWPKLPAHEAKTLLNCSGDNAPEPMTLKEVKKKSNKKDSKKRIGD